MKWYKATIYERIENGEDATHNPVTELRKTETEILVRTAPKTISNESTEGNRFDVMERVFLTKAAPALLKRAAAIEVQGALYEIEGLSVLGTPITLKVKRCKHGILD